VNSALADGQTTFPGDWMTEARRFIQSNSFRYALALWLATIGALLAAFIIQLEPAQWAGITVWIMFIQVPRLNYSKILWWSFGTIVGALMAVLLTVFFNQAPEVLVLFLALWLAVCSATSTLVTSFRAYGWVLAGYTCAIVSMSAVDHPDQIFRLAVSRVSAIFIGMTSAILFMTILLPMHRHWRSTLHHLGEHLKATVQQAARALEADPVRAPQFTWRHLVDRLSTLEHTLDLTTAESPDARVRTPQARSLVATLFDLLAKAQAIEVHLSRPGAVRPMAGIAVLLADARNLLVTFASPVGAAVSHEQVEQMRRQIEGLTDRTAAVRGTLTQATAGGDVAAVISNRFLLDRLDEVLVEFGLALQDWAGLSGDWAARRETRLSVHADYMTAFIYGTRMFLAVILAGAFWCISEWPSGPILVLFTAVVCSLLSLLDEAPRLGFPFLKSAAFCAIMAYVETFWLLPAGEGFLVLALMLGLFLLPAAYAYRHPRLVGGAVVSMLIFYGLTQPSNQMNYDIVAFLNNGIALLCATAWGFYIFHAVPSLGVRARQFWLLRAMRRELAHPEKTGDMRSEQDWTSRMFDRLRLLHRAGGESSEDVLEAENELLVGLQLGLRQRKLRAYLEDHSLTPEFHAAVVGALQECREISRHANVMTWFLHSLGVRLAETVRHAGAGTEKSLGALAELDEMSRLLETSNRFYLK
jgi:uncharacterized membrane protein YccC